MCIRDSLALDAEWGMNDLNLHIPGVYFSGEKTDVGAVLNFAEGGSLSTDVGYNIESSEFDIGIQMCIRDSDTTQGGCGGFPGAALTTNRTNPEEMD